MTDEPRRYGGRYEIEEPLASGGMAEVFTARDTLLGRRVALKTLHPEYARDRAFLERFRREAQAAASLNDPRIVSIYDYGPDNGSYYIVMEFVEGKTLKEIIATEGPLTPERSVEIAAEVCHALEAAHGKGIVHRDIKPANIAVGRDGKVKVMDFGIARAASNDDQTVTQTGTVIGTAAYFSPEQAQGMAVDARSDVYSVGVVLYEMLTREVPFKGDTAVAIAYKHVKEDPAPPSQLDPTIPAELDAIVMKALAKNPDNRYQSAREMGEDLKRALRGESVHATPVLPPDQTAMMQPADRTTVMPRAATPAASPRRRAFAYFLIFVLFFSLIVLAVMGLFSLFSGSGPTVVVPDVVGMALPDAERTLEREGLEASVEEREPNESIPEGSVSRQDPSDGRKVEKGAVVRLWISSGAATVEVPDLVGKTEDEARALLSDAGLELGAVASEFNDEVEASKIFRQDPRPGARVDKGSSVDVVVSGGKKTVKVPNVEGLDEASARERLLDANLNPKVIEVCNTAERNGRVLKQEPAPRTDVPEGSDVTLTVNRAPTVPAVVGQTQESATKELQDAGFVVKVELVDNPSGKSDRVLSQDPRSGDTACKGDTVTIIVET